MKKLLCTSKFRTLNVESFLPSKKVEIKILPRDESKNLAEEDSKTMQKVIEEFQPDCIFSTVTETRQFFPIKNLTYNKNLKLIQQCTTGFNNIDVSSANEQGVVVCNAPNKNAKATAEMAVLLMLTVMRNVKDNINFMRHGNWKLVGYLGNSLQNKTLGIVGLGRIGLEVARKANAFDMNVTYYDIMKRKEEDDKVLNIKPVTFDELMKNSDVISIHVPLNKYTKYLVSAKQFDMMKKSAVVINTSRGAVIKESDLMDALKKKKIAGAGMDVFEEEPVPLKRIQELWSLGVTTTPHMGGLTGDCLLEMETYAIENIKRVLIESKDALNPIVLRKKKK